MLPWASVSTVTTPYNASRILPDCPTAFMEDGLHPPASVVGTGAGGEAVAGAACVEGADGTPPITGDAVGIGVWTAAGGAGDTARIAPWTSKSFSAISPESTPSCAMMSSSVAAAVKNAPALLPVDRSVTVTSMLYPFPSLETVPWIRRGYFASRAASSGDFPPAGSSKTSAPASAIRREARRRGRTETVPPISSFVRDANGAMAMRREYPAADAGTGDVRTQETRRTAPRTARATCRPVMMRIA